MKSFERSNGLDTALYKTTFFLDKSLNRLVISLAPLHLFFDQCRVNIFDQVEYGVPNRLHIYPLCVTYFTSHGIATR